MNLFRSDLIVNIGVELSDTILVCLLIGRFQLVLLRVESSIA